MLPNILLLFTAAHQRSDGFINYASVFCKIFENTNRKKHKWNYNRVLKRYFIQFTDLSMKIPGEPKARILGRLGYNHPWSKLYLLAT
jgi:hypothetical protein